MSDTKTMSTSARFAQIVSILRKHHIQKGMDPVKFRMILEDLGPTFVKNWPNYVNKTGFVFSALL